MIDDDDNNNSAETINGNANSIHESTIVLWRLVCVLTLEGSLCENEKVKTEEVIEEVKRIQFSFFCLGFNFIFHSRHGPHGP